MKHTHEAWVAGLVLALAVVGGCAGEAERGPWAGTDLPVVPESLAAAGLALGWETQVLLDPGTVLTDLWVRGPYLVAKASNQRVFVIDAESGVRRWSKVLAEPHETIWPPALYRDQLWFATTTRLMGFLGEDGRNITHEMTVPPREAPSPPPESAKGASEAAPAPAWPGGEAARRRAAVQIAVAERRRADLDRLLAGEIEAIELDFAPSGPPVADGTHVFIPDAKGWLQAVAIRPRTVSWGRWTGDAVTAGPVVDATRVYFAGHNGVVYASTRNVRHIVWQYQTEGPIVADLRLTETGTLLVGSLDYSLYAFDGASGVLEWETLPNRRYNAGEPIRKPAYTFGEQVFLFTARAGLAVLDAATGKVKWRWADGTDLVSADAQAVYVLNRRGDLVGLDRQTGKERFTVPLRRGTRVGINETGTGYLYLATPAGRVVGLRAAAEAEPAPPAAE